MAAYSTSPTLKDRAITYFWFFEQKLATLLAITFGTFVGLAYGAVHAVQHLGPHLTSIDGAKRLYHGDPASTLSSQSRQYVTDNFVAAKLKPSGELVRCFSLAAEAAQGPRQWASSRRLWGFNGMGCK